jgi:ribosomal protein L30/L7E
MLGRIAIHFKNFNNAENYLLHCLNSLQNTSDNSQRIDGLVTLALLKGLSGHISESKRIIELILSQKTLQVAQKREIQTTLRMLNLSITENLQVLKVKESIQDLVNEILLSKSI